MLGNRFGIIEFALCELSMRSVLSVDASTRWASLVNSTLRSAYVKRLMGDELIISSKNSRYIAATRGHEYADALFTR